MMRCSTADDGRLHKALRTFELAWQGAGEGWRDQTRQEVADQLVEPYQQRAREAERCLRELDLLLREAIEQCR